MNRIILIAAVCWFGLGYAAVNAEENPRGVKAFSAQNETGPRKLSIAGVKAFQKRCEKSGGIFMDCAAAFTHLCADATTIDGRDVICSCKEGAAWDQEEGCVHVEQ